MEIGLVSCTKSKRDTATSPRKLYDKSALFRKAREYCERHHDQWFVLSAEHGLLEPDGPPIAPYDTSLTTASDSQRRAWATDVRDHLVQRSLLTSANRFVIHAGKAYYDDLCPLLVDAGADVELPTEGLGLGETLAWYNAHHE